MTSETWLQFLERVTTVIMISTLPLFGGGVSLPPFHGNKTSKLDASLTQPPGLPV